MFLKNLLNALQYLNNICKYTMKEYVTRRPVCACMSVFVIIVLGPVQGEALDRLSVVATKPGSAVFLEAKWACRPSSSSACEDGFMLFASVLIHLHSFSLLFGAVMKGVFMVCLSADVQQKGVEFESDPAVWKSTVLSSSNKHWLRKLKAWEMASACYHT